MTNFKVKIVEYDGSTDYYPEATEIHISNNVIEIVDDGIDYDIHLSDVDEITIKVNHYEE